MSEIRNKDIKWVFSAFKNGAGVFRVNAEWPGLRQPRGPNFYFSKMVLIILDDLVCSIGDLVYVEHSTKKNGLWECWNGKKNGCIDGTLLSFVSIAQMERPQSTPLVHNHDIPNPTSVTLLGYVIIHIYISFSFSNFRLGLSNSVFYSRDTSK